jgi:curved DNA-binding protein
VEYKDYYKIMGVDRGASQDEIKRAYRKLARKYHPDVSKEADAEARFKEVGEAYEVLKDPEKRAAYDQLGANWKQGQDFRPPPDWQPDFDFRGSGFSGADAEQFSDFFEELFGGGFRQARTRSGFHAHGQDNFVRVMIDLEDAYTGATRQLQLPERTLNVRIPKGVRQGQQIRLAGQGGVGLGQGKAGDLFLEVEFHPHAFYHVEGKDVFLDLPVAPWEAALGATIKAPTPAGPVDLKIPANTAAGRKLRLKGRGIPSATPGDLYAVIQIALPVADDASSRRAYESFRDAVHFNPRKKLGV